MVVLVAMPTTDNAVVILMSLNSLSEPQALDTKNQHYKDNGSSDVLLGGELNYRCSYYSLDRH